MTACPTGYRAAHVWALDHVPRSRRLRIALAVAAAGVFLVALIAASRLLHFLFGGLDVLAYLGLFLVNWIGAGGLLVPIPGVRIVGWIMVIQQGGVLDPLIVGIVAGVAMAVGQISYYVAANARAHRAVDDADHAHDAKHPERGPSLLSRLGGGERVGRAKDRVERQLDAHGFATIVILSLLPNPLTMFACATAGATGMGFRRFILASLLGRLDPGAGPGLPRPGHRERGERPSARALRAARPPIRTLSAS